MQFNSRNRLENDENDDIDESDGHAIEADDLDTTVHVDVATGRIKFHSTWALTADAPPEFARHAVELALDSDTMERYASLDDGTRMRVHAILHDTVQAMLDRLPDTDESLTLTIEVTDAMLDTASRLQ
ncbi:MULTISPECIES: DUF3022 domain-containing protein [Burkholderia]|uniref:DUF3022 domain-containing protein n=1 Tax=Burkholderia contaminans TaxID=488447 RepID=A0A2S5DQL7_9BURK|nr:MULTISPECIES: DUF3022 domain-containing protein [Burkholderia]EKS9797963.1 DUF3022 domain-containing protein [Burkholderia cepacia]EKS9805025.1 DUF3022 domain-containing protein [Burkholderia cepacia]EKS9816018.1 DUF3022 domain-containing protein [Burkholderia cepacia]EKS9822748.1 DUF3022 domain-containing protein [Burkholderia cepacia]EKS9830265.1 DUF3022 domain-containing protein [Burkholderia cepacia]